MSQEMRNAIQSDRSIIHILEISELGLMELTRRRVRDFADVANLWIVMYIEPLKIKALNSICHNPAVLVTIQ